MNPIRLATTYAIQRGTTFSKFFGPTNISGHASVIQGDVYLPNGVLNIQCTHSEPHSHSQPLPSAKQKTGVCDRIVRTLSRRHNGWRILPCIVLMQKTTTENERVRTERSWTISINFLQRFMLTFSVVHQRSSLTLFRPNLRNIVPDDAPFLMACKRGDIITMRRLISEGQGSYLDVTKDNLTPMYFALESGQVVVVQEVLNNSEDVDTTFGNNQTSALSWALYHRDSDAVSGILTRNADLQHISLLGWTPVFYLWRDQTGLQDSCLEILQMLRGSDPEGFRRSVCGIFDIGELSLLHRVASLGTPDEVRWLLDCGVNPCLRAGQLSWTAMFDAAYDGRLDNLQVLEEECPGSAIRDRDLRGWSLLHVAAAEGHKDVVRWLLRNGAKPFAKSQASFVDVPEALIGMECTPAEAARAESIEKEQDFWDALRDQWD